MTDLPTGAEKARRVRSMFDAIAGRYDLVNRLMTLGLDVGWRRTAVAELRLPGGALVADLACGTGDLCTELRTSGYRAVGFDFSRGMLEAATTSAPLVQADVLCLPLRDASVDGATSGFALRNVTDLGALFLGRAFDLLAAYRPGGFFLERRGVGVSGSGAACEDGAVRLDEAASVAASLLRRVDRDRVDGAAPVAAGAFPFGGGPGRLVVPERAAIRTGANDTWQLEIRSEETGLAERTAGRRFGRGAPHEAFTAMQLRADPAPEAYGRAVAEATRRIRAGELRKVVLARSLVVEAGRELDPTQLVWRLRAVDPGCFAFAVPAPGGRTLVGATPELLVAKRGREVTAGPLAGSAPRFGDPDRDRASAERLLASAKDREEHAVVVEAVAEVLGPRCEDLRYPTEPELLGTANVWHLSTPFTGTLRPEVDSVLELVAALHPTPAVCGTPRDLARAALAELEPFDRGLYAGPVGWVDAEGDGEWAIALRCAEVGDRTARLFAGAGIVADSVPELELDETEAKFRALLDSLRWG
ncbi:MAG: isochorismate synthase [Candidatus Velamenicoccus archaeovorus]